MNTFVFYDDFIQYPEITTLSENSFLLTFKLNPSILMTKGTINNGIISFSPYHIFNGERDYATIGLSDSKFIVAYVDPEVTSDKGKCVAIVLPLQRFTCFIRVQAAAVNGDLVVSIKCQRLASALTSKIVDMVTTQTDNVRTDSFQRLPIGIIAAQHQVHERVVHFTSIDERNLIADMGDVGRAQGVGDNFCGIGVALFFLPGGGAARHGCDAGHH